MKQPKAIQKVKPFFRIYNRLSASVSFTQRLYLSFLFIALPIIAGVSILAFFIIQQSSRTIVERTQATELEKSSAQWESIILDTENMSREIIYNTTIQDYMYEAIDPDAYPSEIGVSDYLHSIITNRDYINSIVLISRDRTMYSTEKASSEQTAYQNIQQKWWYYYMTTSTASHSWYPYSGLTKKVYDSQRNNEIPKQINTLMLARPIYSMTDYQTLLGYVMIYLDDGYISSLWQDITWGKSTNVFIYDNRNAYVISNNMMTDYSNILSEAGWNFGSKIIRQDKINYVCSSSFMNADNWTIYMITPLQEINDSVLVTMTTLISIFGVIILVLFLMSRYSATNMARPVISLSKMMDSYHGSDQKLDEESIHIYQTRTDEIGQMYRSFEQMEDRLNRLIQEIYVKNLEKKDAELALLQSQINPHFLYNTLDSINWIALANDQDEISDMITALSDTFRLSLMKNNSSFVEMEQEVQYIKSYLVLQKFRYAERLSYDFDIPDPIPALFIPRFIMQPVVENALKHGINSIEAGGKLIIRIIVSDNVIIQIINDGNNIDLEKMKRILVFNPEDSDILNFKKEGYGVQNIHRRIKIICGDDYGLTYSKTASQTICTINLPYKETLA